MGGCLAMSDLNISCDDIKKIGGVQGDGYILNLKDANGDKLQALDRDWETSPHNCIV